MLFGSARLDSSVSLRLGIGCLFAVCTFLRYPIKHLLRLLREKSHTLCFLKNFLAFRLKFESVVALLEVMEYFRLFKVTGKIRKQLQFPL